MQKHIIEILKELDPDHLREGLKKTPERVSQALKYLCHGYQIKLDDIFKNALFQADNQDLILIQNIEFYSMCEHHLLPFFGHCHIAYIPDQHILGLSKFAEVLDVFARRLQIQERLTEELANCLFQYLKPKGLGIIIEAQHLCMMMRGIEKQQASLTTQKFMADLNQPEQQHLFFNLLRK